VLPVTRVEINEFSLRRELYADMRERAAMALLLYTQRRRAYDSPSYPFARHEDQRSVRDPASQEIRTIPGGIQIVVTAPGAYFEEFGNDQNRQTIHPIYPKKHLTLPAKRGASIGSRNGRLGVDPRTGKAVFLFKAVDTYDGKHRLRDSARIAFGIDNFFGR